MINSSNISLTILISVVLIGYVAMNSLKGKNGRLPPLSTPEGKRGRAIMVLILILLIGTYVIYIRISGRLDDEASVRRMLLSMAAGGGVAIFLLAKNWKKDKK